MIQEDVAPLMTIAKLVLGGVVLMLALIVAANLIG